MTLPQSRVSALVTAPFVAVRETFELAIAVHGLFVELQRAMVQAARDVELAGDRLAGSVAEVVAEEEARRAA